MLNCWRSEARLSAYKGRQCNYKGFTCLLLLRAYWKHQFYLDKIYSLISSRGLKDMGILVQLKIRGKIVEQNYSSDCNIYWASSHAEELLEVEYKRNQGKVRLLSPLRRTLSWEKRFSNYWLILCVESPKGLLKIEKRKVLIPCLEASPNATHVWESPLVPISLVDGHTCWGLRACRGEAD